MREKKKKNQPFCVPLPKVWACPDGYHDWGQQRRDIPDHLKCAFAQQPSFFHPTTIRPLYLANPIGLRDSNDLGTKLIGINNLVVGSQYPYELIETEVPIKILEIESLLYVIARFPL